MGIGLQSSGNFLVTDVAGINEGPTTLTYPTLLSHDVQVWDREIIYVQCKVTGEAATNALGCMFRFVASADGVNFTTEYFLELEVLMLGTAPVCKGWHVNVTGIHSLRLQQLENLESVVGRAALAINARWGKSYGQ